MRRTLVTAAALVAAAAPLHAQHATQGFQVRPIRNAGLTIAVTRSVGDWNAAEGYTIEAHGADVERGPLGARASFGHVTRAGQRYNVLLAGADVAIDTRALPLMLTVGAEFARADAAADTTITRIAAPVHLSNSAVIVFDSFWIHPIIGAGFVLHRTEVDVVSTGIEALALAGLEAGSGPVSLRATLQHRLTARQHATLALRVRL